MAKVHDVSLTELMDMMASSQMFKDEVLDFTNPDHRYTGGELIELRVNNSSQCQHKYKNGKQCCAEKGTKSIRFQFGLRGFTTLLCKRHINAAEKSNCLAIYSEILRPHMACKPTQN